MARLKQIECWRKKDMPVAPTITSEKWIQVCEIERGTFASSKASVRRTEVCKCKGQARASKAQDPVANDGVGQHFRCRHLPLSADDGCSSVGVDAHGLSFILCINIYCFYCFQ